MCGRRLAYQVRAGLALKAVCGWGVMSRHAISGHSLPASASRAPLEEHHHRVGWGPEAIAAECGGAQRAKGRQGRGRQKKRPSGRARLFFCGKERRSGGRASGKRRPNSATFRLALRCTAQSSAGGEGRWVQGGTAGRAAEGAGGESRFGSTYQSGRVCLKLCSICVFLLFLF